ncbi:mediator complex subunit Med20 [Balamuthia mandrillaris]
MGVKCVFPFSRDPQALGEMKQRVERLRGKKVGDWSLYCTLYLHESAKEPSLPETISKELYLLREELFPSSSSSSSLENDSAPSSSSSSTNKCYLMLQGNILEAGLEMQSIIKKAKLYKPRQTVHIKGFQYEIGDFGVKIGSIMLGNNNKGVVVEVEYRPCLTPNQCQGILNEFIGNLGPFDVSIPRFLGTYVPFDGLVLPTLYSMRHTTSQYVRLFHALKLLKPT